LALSVNGPASVFIREKPRACGEGGALVTNNTAFAARARSLREHGSSVRYYHDEVVLTIA
jgi:dTDP-4-amino-4,6-dideoxygalactose transaminase